MTKSKKKMSKQSLVIVIMSILMIGMLAFGGTYAYFTATATAATGTITTGYVKLTSSGTTFTITATNVMPGDEIDITGYTLKSDVTNDNGGTTTSGAYIALKVTLSATGTGLAGSETDYLKVTASDDWYYDKTTGLCYYGSEGVPKAYTDSETFMPIKSITFDANDDWVQTQSASTSGLMSATITITIEAHSIQAKNNDGCTVDTLSALFTT